MFSYTLTVGWKDGRFEIHTCTVCHFGSDFSIYVVILFFLFGLQRRLVNGVAEGVTLTGAARGGFTPSEKGCPDPRGARGGP